MDDKILKNEKNKMDSKRPGDLRLDVGITVFLVLLAAVIRIAYYFCMFKYARTGLSLYYSSSFVIVLSAASLTFCLLLLILARLFWTIPQNQAQRLRVRILLLILISSIVFLVIRFPLEWSGRKALQKGVLERIQNDADIESIRQWWQEVGDQYQVIEYIDKKEWPEAIKQLNPHYIEVGRRVYLPKYVTLTWSAFGGTYWELNVGPKTMDTPSPRDDNIMQEDFITVGDGAFVSFTYF